jgi:hypothetical protein
MAWFKPTSEIVMMLTLLNARSAARGKPCPIAARVVERLEAQGD